MKLLKVGPCPVCEKKIIEKNKTLPNYAEFLVRFNDNSKATFAICKDCLKTLTNEQVIDIVKRQKMTWGIEVVNQMLWYTNNVPNLEMTEWSRDGLPATDKKT